MNYDQLVHEFTTASSIKLLKADLAPMIIHFLTSVFRHPPRVSLPFTEFIDQLNAYLHVRRQDAPTQAFQSASEYTALWSDDEHQFIKVTIDPDRDQKVVELTAGTIQVLTWMERLHPPSFVGTESRLLSIVQWLEEITQDLYEDVPARVARLERERARIQEQIDHIRATGKVTPQLSQTQLRERFRNTCDTARALLGDFLVVEKQFYLLARTIVQEHILSETPKGLLIMHILDANDALKTKDEGKSFYAFWAFLTSPEQMERLRNLLQRVLEISWLVSNQEDQQLLSTLPISLLLYSEKIMISINRLADQLIFILNDRIIAENIRIGTILSELRQTMLNLSDTPSFAFTDPCLTLSGSLVTRLAAPRFLQLWHPDNGSPTFEHLPTEDISEELTDEELRDFFAEQEIVVDEELLLSRIHHMLTQTPQITLEALLAQFPLTQGLAEVLTYIRLANQESRHTIEESQREQAPFQFAYPHDTIARLVDMPRVTYHRAQETPLQQQEHES